MKYFGITSALAVCFLSAASSADAQDFAAQWVDKITRQLQAEQTPLKEPSQLTYGAQAGVIFVYDSNVFLTENNRISDQIWVPFLSANIAYVEPQWDIAADLQVDYRYYVETQDARDDDERFFLKAGYTGSTLSGSIIQLVRHESDPTDVTFASRTERLVSDTIPRISVDITPAFAVEADGYIQIVRFKERPQSLAQDNENYQAALALVYKTLVGVDLILKGGLKAIHYNDNRNALGDPTAPPDVKAWFATFGFRGELRPDLFIDANAGILSISTEDFEFVTRPQRDGFDLNTMIASVMLRYKSVEGLIGSVGYSRDMTFLGLVDPFQIVDSVVAMAEYQATEQITMLARAQLNLANSSTGVHRNYTSLSLRATYRPIDHMVIDAGVTARFGGTSGDVANDTNYTDFVLQLGLGLSW